MICNLNIFYTKPHFIGIATAKHKHYHRDNLFILSLILLV
jgi:hypothetical protein